jgi:hypothetical protein
MKEAIDHRKASLSQIMSILLSESLLGEIQFLKPAPEIQQSRDECERGGRTAVCPALDDQRTRRDD